MEMITEEGRVRYEHLTVAQFQALVGVCTYHTLSAEFGPKHTKRGNYVEITFPELIPDELQAEIDGILSPPVA